MYNFTYAIQTIVHFGEGQISHLKEMRKSGTRVLLVYGGGSIKRSGLYDTCLSILKEEGMEVIELAGVEPNPRIESVRKGANLCKEHNVDMVLAVGGGSTIDCAKIVAAAAMYDGDAWDLVLDGSKIEKALPIYSVLTLAATGSEMDRYAVISDLEKNEKWGTGSDAILPTMSIMDPTHTYSVSKKQTAAGTADIMSHTLENYFTTEKGATLQANLCEAVLKTIVQYGPIAYEEPENYEARANLMWASSYAINGIVDLGAAVAWTIHPMEHELSAFYDITHGEGLAILTPAWMEVCMKKNKETIKDFAKFGRNVFDVIEDNDEEAAKKAVAALREFLFEKLHIPSTLQEVGIKEKTNFSAMAKKAAKGCQGCYEALSEADIIEIYEKAF